MPETCSDHTEVACLLLVVRASSRFKVNPIKGLPPEEHLPFASSLFLLGNLTAKLPFGSIGDFWQHQNQGLQNCHATTRLHWT